MKFVTLIFGLVVTFQASAVIQLPERLSDSWVSLLMAGPSTNKKPAPESTEAPEPESTEAPEPESTEAPEPEFTKFRRGRQDRCPDCKCGIARVSERIVGGHEAEKQKYPWMALLLYNDKPFCGGSLINDRYVLTAAHCAKMRKEHIRVRILEHNMRERSEENTINLKVSRIIIHRRYNDESLENDIALFKLAEPIDFTEKEGGGGSDYEDDYARAGEEFEDITIRPVCLPASHLDYIGSTGRVMGWGYVRQNGPASHVLREVAVPIVSRKICQNAYYSIRITENMLCAGYKNGKKDACQGDSGGPLQVHNEVTNTHHQVGVVSFGSGCAQPNRYGVYTRVNKYMDWIKEHTQDACYCEDSNY